MISEASPATLPEGWIKKELGDVCLKVSKIDPLDFNREIFKYVDIGSIDSATNSVASPQILSVKDAPGRARQLIQEGDTVFSTVRPYLKNIAYINESLDGEIASTGFCVIRANPEIVSKGLIKFFSISDNLLDQILPLQRGVSYPAVRDKDLFSSSILVPPLLEQKNIVEILEEQFSRLDAALASVYAVRLKAARFRLSLLHAAFSGALTGHDSSTEAVPAKWELVELESLLSLSIGGIWGDESGLSEIEVDVVRVTELKAHGVIEPSTAAKRSITRKQFESRALQVGDLLLEKSGGGPNTPVGRVGYVSLINKPTVCSNFMQLMRPNIEKMTPVFLHLFLTFIHSNGETIPMQTSTTNIRNIKRPQYMAHLVPCPQLDEQETIIKILDEQLSRLDSSLAIALLIEKKASAMRRSLLHAAFTGDLTKEWREGAHV